MLTLYPYQNDSVTQIAYGFAKHKRQLLVLPTGGGKTVVFSTIVERSIKKGKVVLVLTDRLELFKETVKSIESFGVPVCKINKDNKTIPSYAKMYVGMVETVKRRLAQLNHIQFDLIICDEAHVASFNKVYDTWPDSFAIGATATPIGKHLYKYFTNLVSCIDTPELVERGFLSPCKAFQMEDDFSDVEITGGQDPDYDLNSLYDHMNKAKIYEGVIAEWLERCKGMKTIVFNVNVEHTIKMTAAFNAAGIKSYCIHNNTPEAERAWILSEFKSGAFPVLNNCGILTKGYNEPSIEAVILNRATMSLPLFLQMIGRGSRLFFNKKFFIVLDFGMNHTRHGMWNEPRTWKLEPPKKKKKTLGAAPVKSCKACSAMLSMATMECPYCGFLFPVPEEVLRKGRMVELTNEVRAAIPGKYISQCTITELIELEKMKQLKPPHVWRIMRHRGAQAIGYYAKAKEYKDAWIIHQLETLEAEMKAGGVTFADRKINEVEFLELT